MSSLPWLDPYDDNQTFPHPETALNDPDGLLAVGGSLSPPRLLRAYRQGIFPWYSAGQPILWWSPNPRLVLFTDRFKVSRSLRKTLRKGLFSASLDQSFATVIQHCAAPRPGQNGTWITPAMRRAYNRLHQLGHAHSLEVWHAGELVGGLYGVAVGRMFFGESMFSCMSDASKVALAVLCAQLRDWEFPVIDCQMRTEHLLSLGAEELPRPLFLGWVRRCCGLPGPPSPWRLQADLSRLSGSDDERPL